jgi:DNA-binding MarR family transcriptional regulator
VALGGIIVTHLNARSGVEKYHTLSVLAEKSGITPRTARRALTALDEAGLILRTPGSGRTVSQYRIAPAFVEATMAKRRAARDVRAEGTTDVPSEGTPASSNTSYTTSDLQDTDYAAKAAPVSPPFMDDQGGWLAAIREAAGVRPPFSAHWSDVNLTRIAQEEWPSNLSAEETLRTIREMRRDRPEVQFNSPTYFTPRLKDVAAAIASSPKESDGRDFSASFRAEMFTADRERRANGR